MRIKRLQNRIAESKFALPAVTVYTILVWLVGGLFSHQQWVTFGCTVIAGYLMVELNNQNSLMRIYSRMVSCSFLVLLNMANFLFSSSETLATILSFVAFYLFFFHAYQDKTASGWVFYAFLCLGIGSIFFVQLLFYIPVLWLLMAFRILSFSPRTLFASILGLLVPYWFVGGYLAYSGETDTLMAHLVELTTFSPILDYSCLKQEHVMSLALVGILGFTGMGHFWHSSYKDKIRTRMIYEIFIAIFWTTLVFMALQPRHFDKLLGILIINTSPLIAHFIALTHTKITNIAFLLIIIGTLTMTVINLLITNQLWIF